jgi:hypothetical protein
MLLLPSTCSLMQTMAEHTQARVRKREGAARECFSASYFCLAELLFVSLFCVLVISAILLRVSYSPCVNFASALCCVACIAHCRMLFCSITLIMLARSYVASVSDDDDDGDDVAASSPAADDDSDKHGLGDGEVFIAVPWSTTAELSSASASAATTAVKSSSASSRDAEDELRGAPKSGAGAIGEGGNDDCEGAAAAEKSSDGDLQSEAEVEVEEESRRPSLIKPPTADVVCTSGHAVNENSNSGSGGGSCDGGEHLAQGGAAVLLELGVHVEEQVKTGHAQLLHIQQEQQQQRQQQQHLPGKQLESMPNDVLPSADCLGMPPPDISFE